jgi:hypothetical protein
LKFVTGLPEEMWSCAPTLPTPCGYRLLNALQLLKYAGAAAGIFFEADVAVAEPFALVAVTVTVSLVPWSVALE